MSGKVGDIPILVCVSILKSLSDGYNSYASDDRVGSCSYLNAELEITVRYFPTIFSDLAEQIQFARTNLLHIFNGEANNSL